MQMILIERGKHCSWTVSMNSTCTPSHSFPNNAKAPSAQYLAKIIPAKALSRMLCMLLLLQNF